MKDEKIKISLGWLTQIPRLRKCKTTLLTFFYSKALSTIK